MLWFDFADSIWNEFDKMQREIEELFDLTAPLSNIRSATRGSFPLINVGETPENVIVYILAPGIDSSKIDLTIEKNLLTIGVERDTIKDIGDNVSIDGYHRRERISGKFKRIISLPETVDPNNVKAEYKNGIIVVTIGKKEEEKSKKIEVAIE